MIFQQEEYAYFLLLLLSVNSMKILSVFSDAFVRRISFPYQRVQELDRNIAIDFLLLLM